MNCYEAIDLMGEVLEGSVAPEARPGFAEHLDVCAACRNYFEQLSLTVAALGHLPPQAATRGRRAELLATFRKEFQAGS